MKSRYTFAVAISALMLAAAGAQAATHTHTVSGVACQASSDANYWWTDHMTFHANSNMWVDCPLQRDNISNTNGITLKVYAGQPQFVSGSYCTARSLGINGGGIRRAVTKHLPMYAGGTDHMDWGSSLNGSYAAGIYSLECWMNNGAYITQLRWDES